VEYAQTEGPLFGAKVEADEARQKEDRRLQMRMRTCVYAKTPIVVSDAREPLMGIRASCPFFSWVYGFCFQFL
jgi:hypothetical protein